MWLWGLNEIKYVRIGASYPSQSPHTIPPSFLNIEMNLNEHKKKMVFCGKPKSVKGIGSVIQRSIIKKSIHNPWPDQVPQRFKPSRVTCSRISPFLNSENLPVGSHWASLSLQPLWLPAPHSRIIHVHFPDSGMWRSSFTGTETVHTDGVNRWRIHEPLEFTRTTGGLYFSLCYLQDNMRDKIVANGPIFQLKGWFPLMGFSVQICALDQFHIITCYGFGDFFKNNWNL